MLAYVFWHEPRRGVAASDYEQSQQEFHAALAEHPSEGFGGSSLARVEGLPWVGAYEDWYLVDDWPSLGALNEAAVSGRRRGPHDRAAAPAAAGAGGLYRLVSGDKASIAAPFAAWVSKPRATSYEDFARELAGLGGAVWQRQLVLGPGSEFCVLAGVRPELEGADAVLERRPL